jgi:hypothetical protein
VKVERMKVLARVTVNSGFTDLRLYGVGREGAQALLTAMRLVARDPRTLGPHPTTELELVKGEGGKAVVRIEITEGRSE